MKSSQSNARIAMMGAAGLVIVSAFMPWVSLLGFSRSGIDYGDGTITLIVGIVGLVMLWQRWLGWFGQFAAAVIVVAVGFYDIHQAGNLAAIGLYLTFAAGVVWGCAAGYERRSSAVARAAAAAAAVIAEAPVTAAPMPVQATTPQAPAAPAAAADEHPPALPMR
jgi:hypothetical protein